MGSEISKVRMGHLQVIEEEGTYKAGTFLLGNPKTMTWGGGRFSTQTPAWRPHLPHSIQIRLRWICNDFFPGVGFSIWISLGEQVKSSFWVLITKKSISQKAKLWVPFTTNHLKEFSIRCNSFSKVMFSLNNINESAVKDQHYLKMNGKFNLLNCVINSCLWENDIYYLYKIYVIYVGGREEKLWLHSLNNYLRNIYTHFSNFVLP